MTNIEAILSEAEKSLTKFPLCIILKITELYSKQKVDEQGKYKQETLYKSSCKSNTTNS